jgi:hypothetical protein
VDHYPFLGVLPEQAGETAHINALYTARFGVPAVGKRVFIRTVQQINGWQDHPQIFSARVSVAHWYLHKFPLSPRGTSGERAGERGISTKRASSPQPSPPSCVRRRGRNAQLSGIYQLV